MAKPDFSGKIPFSKSGQKGSQMAQNEGSQSFDGNLSLESWVKCVFNERRIFPLLFRENRICEVKRAGVKRAEYCNFRPKTGIIFSSFYVYKYHFIFMRSIFYYVHFGR